MESRGRGGESVKAGPITEHLAHTSGLQRKHIFHDTFNLIFQLIENIHQLLPSDSIYCVHELALTGPAGSSPQGKLQMKAEPGNFELDDIGTLLGSGENSELGPTWECGSRPGGKVEGSGNFHGQTHPGYDFCSGQCELSSPCVTPHAGLYVQSCEMTHLIYGISQVAPRSRVLLQIPELFDFLHLRSTGTTPQVPICPKRHLLWLATNPSPLVSQLAQCWLPSGASSLSCPLTEASGRKGRLSCWHIHVVLRTAGMLGTETLSSEAIIRKWGRIRQKVEAVLVEAIGGPGHPY